MKFISIISLFTAVIIGSCFQQSTEGENQIKQSPNQYQNLKNGIRIDNGTNRGINYTDSSGTDFNIRYIPIKITNDTIIPINFQINFSKEYDYPQSNYLP